MSFGIRVENTDGNVLIDNEYENLCLRRVDEFVVDSSAQGGATMHQILLPSETSILAFTSDGPMYHSGAAEESNGVRHTFLEWHDSNHLENHSVKTYQFDVASHGLRFGNDWGMQVWNESRKLIFDSRSKYLSIIDYIHGDYNFDNPNPPGGVTRRYPGKKVAVIAVDRDAYLTYTQTNPNPGAPVIESTQFPTAKVEGDTVTIGTGTTVREVSGGGIGSGFGFKWGFLVVDITTF